jgi:adenylate cyclase
MYETSIDVIASALSGDALAQIGESSSPDGALTLLFCELANIEAIRAAVPERLQTLLEDQRMLATRIVEQHRGRVARAHEDGFMAVFDSAHAGLRCAIELQHAFAHAEVGETRAALELRAGLHTGPVIDAGEGLYGRNVLLAARVAGQARGGEIVVSAKVKQYTDSDPSFRFSERGEHHFKGLHGEHELFAVAWDAVEPADAPVEPAEPAAEPAKPAAERAEPADEAVEPGHPGGQPG